MRRRRRSRRLEACQSPVWDTALAVVALADAGVAPDDPAPRAGGRLAARRGGRACPATGRCAARSSSPAGGRSSSPTTNYPDVDDTAEVVLALRRVEHPDAARVRRRGRPRRSRWIDRHAVPRRRLGRVRRRQHQPRSSPRLPFCDFGEVIDPPSADVTAHVVEMLAGRGRGRPRGASPRGIAWLLASSRSPTARGSGAGA